MLGITRKPRWTDTDRALAMAHSLNESLRCAGCGLFVDETHHADGFHEAETVTCDGCRALEEAQAEDEKPEPGTKFYVPRAME